MYIYTINLSDAVTLCGAYDGIGAPSVSLQVTLFVEVGGCNSSGGGVGYSCRGRSAQLASACKGYTSF